MGKIKARLIGDPEVEKKQKEEQKQKAMEKKQAKKKLEVEKEESSKTVKEKKPAKKAVEETKKSPTNTKKRGKKYQSAKNNVDKHKHYSLAEAVVLLKKNKYSKFNESIELHFNVDEVGRKGEVSLPYATGKSVKVVILNDAVLAEIEKGMLNFDILVTHPSFMPKLAKYARVLGPKGLMPNPKAGTISTSPEKVAEKFSKGVLRWKTEAKFPLVHQIIAKISSPDAEIVANALEFIKSVGKIHISKAFVKSTMSPSLKIDLENIKD